MATLFEGIIITFSGLYILYEAVKKFVFREQIEYLGASLGVMGISLVVTFALVLFQAYVVRKTDNLVIKSDMLHYKTDLLSNAGILLALIVIKFTGFYYIDAII
jgi:cation diffusion facilitator family transporter